MILSLPFLKRMAGVGTLSDGTEVEIDLNSVKQQFRRTKAQIVAGWNIEHKPDGSHRDITADAITADSLTLPALAAIAGVTFDVETLSTYTGGTWTPVLGGGGGTSGQTYTTQSGTFLKIGELVVLYFRVVLSAEGTITSGVEIQGLPFTSRSETSTFAGFGIFPNFAALATNWIWLGGYVNGNARTLNVTGIQAAGTGVAGLTAADIGNTTDIGGVIVYRAAS